MNKRMRNFLVSLGMVVVLGSGNALAYTQQTNITATTLKSVMDPADDYVVFANNVELKAHTQGSIAANTAKIYNSKVGLDGAKVNDGTAEGYAGNDTSFIVKITNETNQSEPFTNGHTAVLDMTINKVEKYMNNAGWKLIKDNKDELLLANNDDQINLKAIGDNGLGKDSRITINSALEELRGLSVNLTTATFDNHISSVNINASALKKGTGSEGDYYDIELIDADADGYYGVTVVNVVVPADVEEVVMERTIRIKKGENGPAVVNDWSADAGKVLFNFVTGKLNEDKTISGARPYAKLLKVRDGVGVILAPSATVTTYEGNHDGSIICENFTGNSNQLHQVEFNVTDKSDNTGGGTDGGTAFDKWENQIEAGDSLLIVPLGVAAVGAAVVFFANRKDDDEE